MENFFFYAYITTVYGLHITRAFKGYANYNHKLANKIPQRIFLIRCRKAKLIPDFIQNSSTNQQNMFKYGNSHRKKLHNVINNCNHKVLNVVINEKVNSITFLESKLADLEEFINSFNDPYISKFITKQKLYKFATIKHLKEINTKKFNQLKRRTLNQWNFNTDVKEDWLINLTTVDIPVETRWLLSLGKKFALPIEQKSFPMFNFIADVENILSFDEDENRRDLKRSKIAKILHKEKFHNGIKSPVDAEIIRIHKKSKRFLEGKNLVVTSADKGNRTVVMDKSEYDIKMKGLLSDQQTYRELKYDTTDILQGRITHMMTRFKTNNWLTDEEITSMIMYNAAIPKIYGSPKVHKTGIPLRPVVASYESPAYKASIYMKNVLKQLTKDSRYNVKNSFEFIDKIRDSSHGPNCKFVSFDVTSLFTNVPLDLLEQILEERWAEIEQYTTIPKLEFFQLLNYIIRDCNQFTYNKTIYKQIEGVPMGLPLSPILADIVMEYVLDEAMSKLNYQLDTCVKYVDDLFLIIPEKLVDYTLNVFNSVNSKIQFTHVEENNNELAFLDTVVLRNLDGTIDFRWYTKPTSSNRLINYNSNHPINHKLNVVDNLIRRIYGLSSDKFHTLSTKTIKSILTMNDYPMDVIDKRIRKFLSARNQLKRSDTSNDIDASDQSLVQYRGLQFHKSCSKNIGKILCEDIPELRIGYRPTLTNSVNFSKLKQRTLEEVVAFI